jgi:ketosteroid isomerase-like protein
MAAAAPIQQPITGREPFGDLTQPIQALAQFYRAFNERDLARMAENWHNSSEASMDNPLGGIKRGWNEIRPVYEHIFNSPAKVNVEFYDYTIHPIDDVFYAVGRERGHLQAKDSMLDLAIRTTRIFRRDGSGRWRQVHHHGCIEDPKLLAAYQAAVR